MATVQDLGRLVKAKYPGKYDSIPDDEVGRRVKAKYPAYASFEDIAPSAPLGRKDLLSMVPVPLPGGGGFTDLGSVSRNLPTGLGLTGGVLGGPVLGGAGAAVGDLGRQALEGETISPKRALGRGAMEAGSQLAGLGVGAGLAYGASKVGPRLAAQAAQRLASGKGGGLGLELPGMGFLLGGGHGAAAGGAAAVGKAIATNPHVQKQLARALSSGALQRALIHGGPRAAAAVLNAYISEQDSTR